MTHTPPHAAVSTSASTAAASLFAQRSNNRSVARVGSDPVSGGPHPASVSPSPFQSLFFFFDISRISEMHEAEKLEFVIFPTPSNVAVWKMNFKSEVRSGASYPSEAIVWIDEMDAALSMDELKTSESVAGRFIPDFEILDSKIASALKKKLTPNDFKKRVYMEETKAQKEPIFLKGDTQRSSLTIISRCAASGAILDFLCAKFRHEVG